MKSWREKWLKLSPAAKARVEEYLEVLRPAIEALEAANAKHADLVARLRGLEREIRDAAALEADVVLEEYADKLAALLPEASPVRALDAPEEPT